MRSPVRLGMDEIVVAGRQTGVRKVARQPPENKCCYLKATKAGAGRERRNSGRTG